MIDEMTFFVINFPGDQQRRVEDSGNLCQQGEI